MISTFRRLLPWGDHREVYCECRRCGVAVEAATEECPVCGANEVARYDVE